MKLILEDREATALAVLIDIAMDAMLSDALAEMATDLLAKLEQARPMALIDGRHVMRLETVEGEQRERTLGAMPMSRRLSHKEAASEADR